MLLRALACLLAIAASPAQATPTHASPQRVVSLNLCADELLLRLAAPGTVKSITWLARDPTLSNVAAIAKQVPVNRGLAEDVIPLDPDLVIAGAYTTRTAVTLLKRVGIRVLELEVPTSVDQALQQITDVAAALGTQARGAELVADIRRRLGALALANASASETWPIAAVYQPNGYTIGRQSVVNDLLSRAGLRNLAVEQQIDNYGSLPLEVLLLAQPDLLVLNAGSDRTPALAYEVLHHPALAQRYRGARVVSVPSPWWSCPGPAMVDAVQRLHEAAQQLPRTGDVR